MNTVGKILVILNFIFAVSVGAFLVVDFATPASWKTEYDKLRGQFTTITADRDQWAADAATQRTTTKLQILEIEKLKEELADQVAKTKVEIAGLELKVNEAQTKQKDADFNLQKAVADVQRLKTSEATLKEIITEREKAILALQDDVKKYRTEAIANDQLVKQLQDRNTELLERLTKAEVDLARTKAFGAGGSEGTRVVSHNEPNPPSTFVKGKIERIDPKDSTLVQISVGTDNGVNKDNTMEVFRTSPAPKYLGMVRIVDASPHHSVGRLIVPAGVSRPQLQEGDLVWSRLK